MQVMKANDRFEFGKHKGSKLKDVVTDDPSYILWAFMAVEDFVPEMKCLLDAKVNHVEEANNHRVEKLFRMAVDAELRNEARIIRKIIGDLK